MALPDSFLDELVARSDIVEVVHHYVLPEKKREQTILACVPFTTKKRRPFPSRQINRFSIALAAATGGGVISFIMKIENLDFLDAVRFLAERGRKCHGTGAERRRSELARERMLTFA